MENNTGEFHGIVPVRRPASLNAAVLHVNTAAATTMSPTMRICRFVADSLSVPLVHNVATAQQVLKAARRKKLDVLFIKHGVLKFSQHRDEALALYENARRVVVLENDYLQKPDSRFIKLAEPHAYFTTVPKAPGDIPRFYVNWNKITWYGNPNLMQMTYRGGSARPLLYYGAFKSEREEAFKRLFAGVRMPLEISTFRGRPHFERLLGEHPRITYRGAMREPAELGTYRCTVYMEDAYSNHLYCSIANRFYECLQYGLPQLFDRTAVHTFETAGTAVPDNWVVDDWKDVNSFRSHETYDFARMLDRQRKFFTPVMRFDLPAQLERALRNML